MQQQNSDSKEHSEQDSILEKRAGESPPVYQAQPIPHKPQPVQSSGFSGDSPYGSSDSNQNYVQQLIDTLQKRNRFMTIMLVLMVLISVSAAFGAFKIYIDYQSATQSMSSLQSDEIQQKKTIVELKNSLDQLQTKYLELTQSSDVTGLQLGASSSKLATTQQMVEALKTNLELVKSQRQQLEQENKIIRSALDTTAAGKEKTLSMIDEQETEMAQLRDQLVFDQQQNKTLKTDVTNRKNAFIALSKRYQNMRGDVFSMEQTLDQSNQQIEIKNKEIKVLQSQITSNAKELENVKKEYAILKSTLRSVAQPIEAPPRSSVGAQSPAKKSIKPITSSPQNTLDVPDEIIIDLN